MVYVKVLEILLQNMALLRDIKTKKKQLRKYQKKNGIFDMLVILIQKYNGKSICLEEYIDFLKDFIYPNKPLIYEDIRYFSFLIKTKVLV